jgi:hypothetical protein
VTAFPSLETSLEGSPALRTTFEGHSEHSPPSWRHCRQARAFLRTLFDEVWREEVDGAGGRTLSWRGRAERRKALLTARTRDNSGRQRNEVRRKEGRGTRTVAQGETLRTPLRRLRGAQRQQESQVCVQVGAGLEAYSMVFLFSSFPPENDDEAEAK